MATPNVLTFDAEGRAIDFAVWIEDLQLYLLCDAVDEVSLFDFVSGAVPAPPADADSAVRSKWATRDAAAARLAVRRHLPSSERAHFSQCKTAQALYDAVVVARYSSPSSATLSRLMLPFLFPDLASFPTVADLVTHLRASDTRYRAALPAEFRAANPPPMYITLYFLVTRLPESLRVVRDQFLSVCPTTLTVDLLEESLLAAEKSIVAVGASRVGRRGVCPQWQTPHWQGQGGQGSGWSQRGRWRRRWGGGGEWGGGRGGGGGVEVIVAAVEAEVAAEVVAEEAVGAVGATVLVGEVAVATGGGVAVEAGVGVAGRRGSEWLVPAEQLLGWSAPAAAAAAATAAAAAAAALSHRPRPSAAP
ncbi:unnamed protein product [Closterium sp. NIES-64]|nr:unnamed protein product [Closterium sp. NIES-64]